MELIKDLGRSFPNPSCKQKVSFGLYRCPVCGIPFKTRKATVKNGTTTKCKSCSTKISNTTHNETDSRLYNIWARMKYRCYNKKNPAYKWYGRKGVYVCDEWKNSYVNFRDISLSKNNID